MDWSNRHKTVSLALQGGGAHGAFTWGVLDRLLEDERIRIEGISGTEDPGASPVLKALIDVTRYFSPYQLNPLNVSPLRDVLTRQVDFERLRAQCGSHEPAQPREQVGDP
jgi:NTE family protein